MLPKRKFIKKTFVAPETKPNDQIATQINLGDLVEQLKSIDSKVKADAVSAIANLQSMDPQIEQQMYSASTLTELINIISISPNPALIQTTLFALNNLCRCETQNNPIKKTVHNLFSLGLDKALIKINSSDANFVKPILIFFGNIAEYIQTQYRYFIEAVQNNLVLQSQKYLSIQKYNDLVIQFLMKSHYKPNQPLTPQQLKCVQLIYTIAQTDKSYRNRAMATKLLTMMNEGKHKQHVQLFCNNFQQFITDIDLQKQYKNNIEPFIKQGTEQEDQQIQKIEQLSHEQQQIQQNNIMQEQNKNKQKSKKNKKKGKNKQKQTQQQHSHKSHDSTGQTSYAIFMDALEGIQIMLQFIVQQFEDQQNFDQDQQQDQMAEQQQFQECGITFVYDKTIFFEQINNTLTKILSSFDKFTQLSFVEGQNIIQLILRMILAIPSNFGIVTNKLYIHSIVILVESFIIHQFKLQMNSFRSIPQQIFIFNFKTALQSILKYKSINNRSIYSELPFLKYQSQQHNNQTLMKINKDWKQCWIDLLQIFSIFYNPQKVQDVTQNQNRNIGAILKQLILQIPQIQLQQWRGQTIDTLFDVYSNQKFDKIFMQFGFIDVLSQVLQVAKGSNKMGGTKNKKSNKFITAVVSDIQRFIAYKKKMIGF